MSEKLTLHERPAAIIAAHSSRPRRAAESPSRGMVVSLVPSDRSPCGEDSDLLYCGGGLGARKGLA